MMVIQIALLSLLGLPICYLSLLSLLALLGDARRDFPGRPVRRFAVVVPAHDEERTIEGTLLSLLAIDYPRELFDIVVVADNCADRTAEVARREDVRVLVRHNPLLRGKGYALRWCFDALLAAPGKYDAIAVVDADTTVSPNFLTVLDHYLGEGSEALQSTDLVKPQRDSWSSEMTRMGFTLYNYARPLGRRALGCSAGLRGNGMCFSTATLRRVPWRAFSIAEDLEYGLELLLHGIRVVFAPEASVLATMPRFAANAETQRARWEMGRFPLIRAYAGRLLRAALGKRSFRLFDALIDLVTPPLVNLLAAVVLMLFVTLALWAAGVPGAGVPVLLWLMVIGAAGIHLAAGLRAAGVPSSDARVFLHLPRYALWKVLLYARMLGRRREKEWIRTSRESTTRIS
jgi:cellulose synthase/poly-beta-1,6-N-acetylglucosamine synthase-like glycosyltransferase